MLPSPDLLLVLCSLPSTLSCTFCLCPHVVLRSALRPPLCLSAYSVPSSVPPFVPLSMHRPSQRPSSISIVCETVLLIACPIVSPFASFLIGFFLCPFACRFPLSHVSPVCSFAHCFVQFQAKIPTKLISNLLRCFTSANERKGKRKGM